MQDFDPEVQLVINRIQSFEKTKEVIDWARKYGYSSINVDLIYGLPKQTVESIAFTIAKIKTLKPDRIAFYSYAFVPWKSKAQRRYTEADLPQANDKWNMYQLGKSMLHRLGYASIGMDHFALANDSLFISASNGTLHRNFMGYTTSPSKLIIALGASAISDSWTAFAQNEVDVESYQEKIATGLFPIKNGHLLTAEDEQVRKKILDLMCRKNTKISASEFEPSLYENCVKDLLSLEKDGLIKLVQDTIMVSEKGDLFIRNICSVLDVRLRKKEFSEKQFSRSI